MFTKKIRFFFKRIFDILIAGISLLFLAPIFLVIAFLIRRDSPGPIFYQCRRMGKNKKPFCMWKFRTMYEDPSSYDGPRITCNGDGRVTPFGSWLRETKINELPQLWNVLKGEMSLVGPRPEDVDIALGWDEEVSTEILSVLPGITSPASILYRDEEKMLNNTNLMEDYLQKILPDKIRLDQLYVRNQTFWTDLDVLFWTIVVITPPMFLEKIPEGHLFSGPFSRFFTRFVSWFLIDLLISLVVFLVVGLIWRTKGPLNWGIESLFYLSVILAFLFSGFNYLFGLNTIVWSKATINNAITLTLCCWFVTIIFLILNFLFPFLPWFQLTPLPTSMILAIGLLAQFGFMLARYRWRIITSLASRWLSWRKSAPNVGEKVLLIGTGEGFSTANRLLRQGEFQYIFSIVGVLDDENLSMQGMKIEGCKILGKTSDIAKIVEEKEIGLVVFTNPQVPTAIQKYVKKQRKNPNIKFLYMDNIPKIFTDRLIQTLNPEVSSIWPQDLPKYQALHDSITGLPNRILFQDRLSHSLAFAKRYETQPLILFVQIESLDGMDGKAKQNMWSEILLQISLRLSLIKRESDTLAYLGEKEFAFIFENVQSDTAVSSISKRILNTLSKPIEVEMKKMNLHFTISTSNDFEEITDRDGKEQDIDLFDRVLIRERIIKV